MVHPATADYIRPSAMQQLRICPGAAQMQAAVADVLGDFAPTEEEMGIAAEGTMLHAAVAECLLAGKAGMDKWQPMANRDLTGYQSAMVRWCVEYALDLAERHGVEPKNMLIEQHLASTGLGFDRGGTADVLLILPFQRFILIDWKFGFLEQWEASLNDQLATYAVMASSCYQCDDGGEVHIFQPRLEGTKRATAAWFPAEALEQQKEVIETIAASAMDPLAPLVPSYDSCFYCDALIGCAAVEEWIMNAMDAMEIIGISTDQDLADAYDWAKVAAKRAEDTLAYVKARVIADPKACGQLKLRSSGSIRSIPEPLTAWMRAREHGLEDQFLAAMSVTPGALTEQLGPDVVDRVFGDLIRCKEKAPSLTKVKVKA